MVEYLENNRLIHPHHHGGRVGNNTATALIQMLDQWVEEVERGRMVGVVLTDLSSAYDMIPFPTMIQKLQCFGFQQESLYWIQSFLQGRQQSTYIDRKPISSACPRTRFSTRIHIISIALYFVYSRCSWRGPPSSSYHQHKSKLRRQMWLNCGLYWWLYIFSWLWHSGRT